MKKTRAGKIAEEIKKEISRILAFELKDPRIDGLISVTAVEVSGDAKYAKIFISNYGSKMSGEEVLAIFKKASGYFRTELGKNLKLRQAPELSFHLDHSFEYSEKITNILNSIEKNDSSKGSHSNEKE